MPSAKNNFFFHIPLVLYPTTLQALDYFCLSSVDYICRRIFPSISQPLSRVHFANENMKCELLLSRVLHIYGNHVAYNFYNDRHQLYNKSFSGKIGNAMNLTFFWPHYWIDVPFLFHTHTHTQIGHDELTFSKHLAVNVGVMRLANIFNINLIRL